MPKGKKQQQQALRIPTAQELYDLWMSQIEPELTMANIDQIDERHAGETAAERKARYARYADAFRRFDERKERVGLELKKVCSIIIKDIDARAAKKQAKADSDALTNIDNAISQAA